MKKSKQPKEEEKPKGEQNNDFDRLLKTILDIPPPEKKKRKGKGQ